jgi:hypothetical protein
MSFRSRNLTRAGLTALALTVFSACSVFENQASEFPDAGPDGPDSLYAGIGQGVPFGEFSLPPEHYRSPYTGAVRAVSRSNVGGVLTAAQAGKLRVVLNLAGPGHSYRTSEGTFDLAAWKSRIDTYRDVDFSPYVTEGLILAHFLIDEPQAASTWGGQQVGQADVEEMARYSKSIWPTLPTAVRAAPRWLLAGDTTYQNLDIAWAQWSGPRRGQTAEEFRNENVALAKQLGVGLIFGMNYLDGGDGSSGIGGTPDHPHLWQMSAAELVSVGTMLAEAPYACAFLSWRHDAAFESRPDIRAALDSVAAVAAARGGTSCLRHEMAATGVEAVR